MAIVLRSLRRCVISSANLYTHKFVFSTLQAVDNKTQVGTKVPQGESKVPHVEKSPDLTEWPHHKKVPEYKPPINMDSPPKVYYHSEMKYEDEGVVIKSISLDVNSEDMKQCFVTVSYLPQDADAVQVKEMFSKYGTVLYAQVVYDLADDCSIGYGAVCMETESAVDDAIADLQGQFKFRKHRVKTTRRFRVRNLPQDVDDEKLKQMFNKFGNVVEAFVEYNRVGHSMETGIVIMEDKCGADSAISNLNKQKLDGRLIEADALGMI